MRLTNRIGIYGQYLCTFFSFFLWPKILYDITTFTFVIILYQHTSILYTYRLLLALDGKARRKHYLKLNSAIKKSENSFRLLFYILYLYILYEIK